MTFEKLYLGYEKFNMESSIYPQKMIGRFRTKSVENLIKDLLRSKSAAVADLTQEKDDPLYIYIYIFFIFIWKLILVNVAW